MTQPGWRCGGVGKAASLQSRRRSVSLLKRPLVYTLLLWDWSVWHCLKPFQGPYPLRKEGEELQLSDFRADLLCATPGLWGGHQRDQSQKWGAPQGPGSWSAGTKALLLIVVVALTVRAPVTFLSTCLSIYFLTDSHCPRVTSYAPSTPRSTCA